MLIPRLMRLQPSSKMEMQLTISSVITMVADLLRKQILPMRFSIVLKKVHVLNSLPFSLQWLVQQVCLLDSLLVTKEELGLAMDTRYMVPT